MRSAVSADRNEAAIALLIGFPSEFDGMAGACRSNDVDLQTLLAQPGESRPAPAAGLTIAKN